MSGLELYLMLRCDDVISWITWVSALFMFLSVTGTVVWGMAGIIMADEKPSSNSWKAWRRIMWLIIIPIAVISFVTNAGRLLIPSTKQVAAIYVLPKMMNNEVLKGIPNKIVDLADDWIDELSPKKTTDSTKVTDE